MSHQPAASLLRSSTYWQELAPGLSVGGERADTSTVEFSELALAEISEHFHAQGYLNLAPVFSETELAPLKRALGAFADAELPPVFIYLYDQPWQLFGRLGKLIEYFLGAHFALLPNFWAWHIPSISGEGGWPPHQDCQAKTRFVEGDGEQTLISLSLWIPLVDVSEDNCCMYVLPRSQEHKYKPAITDPDQIELTNGVALPAKAGSVMGWSQDLYHWSGRMSVAANQPRLSLSLEFQNSAFAPLAEPLLNVTTPPPFETRLALIAAQFEKYKHMEYREFDITGLPTL